MIPEPPALEEPQEPEEIDLDRPSCSSFRAPKRSARQADMTPEPTTLPDLDRPSCSSTRPSKRSAELQTPEPIIELGSSGAPLKKKTPVNSQTK